MVFGGVFCILFVAVDKKYAAGGIKRKSYWEKWAAGGIKRKSYWEKWAAGGPPNPEKFSLDGRGKT